MASEWGTSVFMNPPYSKPRPWVKKAYEESLRGKVIVGLLRGDTSANWFHEFVLGKAELRFIRGRLTFAPPQWEKAATRSLCLDNSNLEK